MKKNHKLNLKMKVRSNPVDNENITSMDNPKLHKFSFLSICNTSSSLSVFFLENDYIMPLINSGRFHIDVMMRYGGV